jgi:hypothetical protein
MDSRNQNRQKNVLSIYSMFDIVVDAYKKQKGEKRRCHIE